jgi:hypothetical protein
MFRGKQFQLDRDTIALLVEGGKRELFHIPSDSIILVISERAERDGTVLILWEDQLVKMFLVDIEERGTVLADDDDINPSDQIMETHPIDDSFIEALPKLSPDQREPLAHIVWDRRRARHTAG